MGPLLILAVLPFAAALLVVLRWRALRRPAAAAALSPLSPLAPGDLLGLRRWQRRVRRALALVGVAYLGLVAASLVDGEPPAHRAAIALALLGAACVLAAAIQFSAHCPRCGYNLGFQARLTALESCDRCGGAFR